ncbi:DUF7305 domain-containing protein [Chromohalobacter israelensis]|uniref:DUF7305 domain-containing protein n=1 Tax=Chromohalobacter israelensis TaxID=141390 RepID=UPI0009FFB3D4|nr:polymer-forming cytoskeletal protein [Chromohalobacter israelensis]MDF9435250.1 polymer-forming cytoskeletal protein [Chromohalobacter israelensis]
MKASKQSGFVLVVGMMLLTVASGAVISGMSVNKYQERQAGNYVRTNNYEAGADEAFRRFESPDNNWKLKVINKANAALDEEAGEDNKGYPVKMLSYAEGGNDVRKVLSWSSEDRKKIAQGLEGGKKDEGDKGNDENIKYAFTLAGVKKIVKIDSSHVRVDFWGKRELSGNNNDNAEGSDGQDILSAIYSIKAGGAYQDALVGCEGVNAAGGGIIDSYDSRDGKYGENGNANKSNATIKSNSQGGDIVLDTGQPVYGDIESAGGIRIKNSGAIHGDLKANENIVLSNGAANVQGNVTSVQAVRLKGGSASITGNVEANQGIFMSGDDAHIYGNATAPNMDPKDPGYSSSMMERISGSTNSSPNVGEVATTTECGAFTPSGEATIDDLIDALPDASSGSLSIGGGSQTYTLTPNGLSNNNTVSDPKKDVTVDGIFPEPTNVLVLDSFSLNGSANFVVDGGDMTLYVKGDVDIGGGATFNVAEGSSLKIVTEGRFNLGSNLNVASESPTDDDGNPILSLYSTYDDEGASGWNAGVNITGASAFKGTIFAPRSTVNVAGSGALYGAVKGRRVEVNGGAGIHYDEALMESSVGTGDGGTDGGAGGGDWTLEGLSYGAND